MVEGARLESEYGPKAHRGFESLPLRHGIKPLISLLFAARKNCRKAPLNGDETHSGERIPVPYLSANMDFSPEANSPVRDSLRSSFLGEVQRQSLLSPARCNDTCAA